MSWNIGNTMIANGATGAPGATGPQGNTGAPGATGALPSLTSTYIYVGNTGDTATPIQITSTTGMTLPVAGTPPTFVLDTPQDLRTSASPTFNQVNVPATDVFAGQYLINSLPILHNYKDNTNVYCGIGAGYISIANTSTNNTGVGNAVLGQVTSGNFNTITGC